MNSMYFSHELWATVLKKFLTIPKKQLTIPTNVLIILNKLLTKIYLICFKRFIWYFQRNIWQPGQEQQSQRSNPQLLIHRDPSQSSPSARLPPGTKYFSSCAKYLRQLYSVCSSSLCLDMVLLPNMYLIDKGKIPFHYYLFWRKNSQNTLMMIIAITIIIGLTVHTLQIIIIIVITIRLNKQTLQIT